MASTRKRNALKEPSERPVAALYGDQAVELGAGAETKTLVMRSTLGYTGEQPRMQMLQNSQFVDAKVEIYLKQGSKALAKLAEYPIQRQLLARQRQE
mgnify:CR=1 FL=1